MQEHSNDFVKRRLSVAGPGLAEDGDDWEQQGDADDD